MRRILIDNSRRKRRPKHGGDRQQIPLDAIALPAEDRFHDLLALGVLTVLVVEWYIYNKRVYI
jgi:hypothetical protein